MDIRPVTNELQRKAEEELNEVPSRIPEDIKHLREWLKSQSHLHARTDDQWLLNFLRGSKFNLRQAKEKLDMFYAMRSLLPEMFTNRDPFLPEIQELLKLGVTLPLSKTFGGNGSRNLLCRYGIISPKISYINIIKLGFMILDILLNEDDNFIIAGQHIFGDAEGLTLEYALNVNLNLLKKVLVCLEKGYPIRPQALDYLNVTEIAETIFNLFKPILSEKIQNKIHMYSEKDAVNIFDIIPPSLLPKDYGGDGDSLDELTAYWKQKVESYKDWFVDDAQYCSDESKRSEKLIYEGIFDDEWSF